MHLPAESYERTGTGGRPESVRPVIFVVEDEEDIARLISHNLQAAGFEVQSFVSGASVSHRGRCGKCRRCFCST